MEFFLYVKLQNSYEDEKMSIPLIGSKVKLIPVLCAESDVADKKADTPPSSSSSSPNFLLITSHYLK